MTRTATAAPRAVPTRSHAAIALTVLRVGLGWIFFWAFLDKLLGLGFATPRANAWIDGGSPTHGFLTFGTQGPFAGLFQAIAGHPVVDTLFMLGLLGIGVSLLVGVAVRLGAYSGITMLVLMWLAALPPANNPFLDDHLVYAVALWAVAVTRHTHAFTMERFWTDIRFVKAHPVLQ